LEEQYVIFRLGEEEYGLDILTVQEIVRPQEITKLPNSPEHVLGLVDLREEVIPIIDLRRFFNLGKAEPNDDNRIIVINQQAHAFGIYVDAVCEVLQINLKHIKTNEELDNNLNKEMLKGVAKVEDRLIILLDFATASFR